MEKVVLTIPTLYGDHHTTAVRRLLEPLPGVSNLLVSAAYRQVSLTYDAGKTPLQAIEKSLADQGYAPGEGELTFPIQTTFAEEATRHTASVSGTGTSLAFAEVTHVVAGPPLVAVPRFRSAYPPYPRLRTVVKGEKAMPDERKKKQRTPQERSMDPAAQEMLIRADELGLGRPSRAPSRWRPARSAPTASCCRMCFMGPCRLVKDGQTGVCGATIETITARNFARAVAAGVGGALRPRPRPGASPCRRWPRAKPRATRSAIRSSCKPWRAEFGIARPTARRSTRSPAMWPSLHLAQFGQQKGRTVLTSSAPRRSAQELWRKRTAWCRAASTARSSTCCTARTWATTRTPSTSCTGACAPRWPTAGAAR